MLSVCYSVAKLYIALCSVLFSARPELADSREESQSETLLQNYRLTMAGTGVSVSCRELFHTSLLSLHPDSLISDCILIDTSTTSTSSTSSTSSISTTTLSFPSRGREYSLTQGCHLVGFGKAVLGLAAALVTRLGSENIRQVTARETLRNIKTEIEFSN